MPKCFPDNSARSTILQEIAYHSNLILALPKGQNEILVASSTYLRQAKQNANIVCISLFCFHQSLSSRTLQITQPCNRPENVIDRIITNQVLKICQ